MVTLRESFEEVIFRKGVEINRKTYTQDILYCDDCDEEITDHGYGEGQFSDTTCRLCGKDLCASHRNPFPTEDTPEGKRPGHGRDGFFICNRCKEKFAKELREYGDYLIVLHEMEIAIEDYKKKFDYNKYKYGLHDNLQRISHELRDQQHKQSKDRQYRLQKKLKKIS